MLYVMHCAARDFFMSCQSLLMVFADLAGAVS